MGHCIRSLLLTLYFPFALVLGLDITPMFHVDWSKFPSAPDCDDDPWQRLRERVVCRLLSMPSAWKHLMDRGFVASITLSRKHDQPLIVALEPGRSVYAPTTLCKKPKVVEHFVRLACLDILKSQHHQSTNPQHRRWVNDS